MQIILFIMVVAFFISCEDSGLGHVSTVGSENIPKTFRAEISVYQQPFKYGFYISGNVGGYADSNTRVSIQVWDSAQSKILDSCRDSVHEIKCQFKIDSSGLKGNSVYFKIKDSLGLMLYQGLLKVRIPQLDSIYRVPQNDSMSLIRIPFFEEYSDTAFVVNFFHFYSNEGYGILDRYLDFNEKERCWEGVFRNDVTFDYDQIMRSVYNSDSNNVSGILLFYYDFSQKVSHLSIR